MSRTRLATVLLLSAALLVRAAPGFSAGTGIVGLVVDGAGKPVPGAEVRALLGERPRAITLTGRILGLAPEEIPQAYVAAHGSRGVIPRSIVYPDGTYRVTGLGPGAWTVTAGTRQRAVTGKVTLQPGQRSANLDISLPDRFPASGRRLPRRPAPGGDLPRPDPGHSGEAPDRRAGRPEHGPGSRGGDPVTMRASRKLLDCRRTQWQKVGRSMRRARQPVL